MSVIYLASPYGFSPATVGFLNELKQKLRRGGHVVNDPWELGEPLIRSMTEVARVTEDSRRRERLHQVSQQIGEVNQKALDASEVVVAMLDGSDVDSGTASEVGYAAAAGKRILGFRGDFRRSGENEGVLVNLQVQYWVERSGGEIYRDVNDLIEALGTSETADAEGRGRGDSGRARGAHGR